MARKVHGGVVGGSGVGSLSVTNTTFTAPLDQDITIDPAGTGIFKIASDAQLQAQGDLRFADADSSNYVAFQAPTTIASNVTWTLPSADAASANQSLVSNGSGTLSFVTTGAQITDDTTDSTPEYLIFGTSTTGTLLNVSTSSSKLTYTPNTGEINCDALLVDGTVRALRTENTYTASHSFILADRDKVVNMNNGADATLTIEPDATTNFPVGSVIYINRTGAGAVTLAAGAGVTLTRSGNFASNEEIYIRKRAANSWITVDAPKTATGTGGAISSGAGYTIHTYTSGSSTFVIA